MPGHNRYASIGTVAFAALCLIATLAFAVPNSDAVSVFFESSVNALFLPPAENTCMNLNAPAQGLPEPTRKNDAVPPLEEVTDAAASPGEPAVFETPADIKEMEAAYLAEYKDAPAAGEVRERFFVNDAATDVLENVAVRNCTEEHSPDFAALLRSGAVLSVSDPAEPVVLIYHTHTSEGYLPAYTGVFYKDYATRSSDPAKNVVRVGEALCAALRERGVGCIHDTQIYDGTYDGAYARSREKVLAYLEQYPSLSIVLDVHRDAIRLSDTVACKPTAVINGKKAAQVMIITGVEEGPVTEFPDWEQNLRFALALQQTAQRAYEGIMKPIYFCRRKYNMDVAPCSLLLEFGSDVNTLEEAVYAGDLMGDALAQLIGDYAKNE